VWRVGFIGAPCGFTPHALCSWNHRFDDPKRKFRTLYCAEQSVTCLRETLAPFRSDLRARREAQARLNDLGSEWTAARKLRMKWRRDHVLAPALLDLQRGELIDLDDVQTRTELENALAELLLKHRIRRLDISVVRSDNRKVTRDISRFLFEHGFAGILYGSAIDDKRCVALFEGKAELVPDGPIQPMAEPFPELHTVCSEFNLSLHRFE
jgi:hypothetical protein